MWTLAAAASSFAATTEARPGDDVASLVSSLRPGDELVLRGGRYLLTAPFVVDVAGTAEAPVTVRAADGEVPRFHRAAGDLDVWTVARAAYLTVSGVELSGGAAGLGVASADHLTLSSVVVHDTAGPGVVAGEPGGRVDLLHLTRVELRDTGGPGLVVGCAGGGCAASAWVEWSWVHGSGQGEPGADGVRLEEGAWGRVFDTVVHDVTGACLAAHDPRGTGWVQFERDAVWGCGAGGVVAVSDTTVFDSIVLGPVGPGIGLRPDGSGAPGAVMVAHDTVLVASGDGIVASGVTGSIVIANNAVYSAQGRAVVVEGDLSGALAMGNFGVGGATLGAFGVSDPARDLADADYRGAPPIDVFPAPGSALLRASQGHFGGPDFNGVGRSPLTDVGAYVGVAGGNPGWALAPGFKEPPAEPAPPPPAEAHTGGAPAPHDSGPGAAIEGRRPAAAGCGCRSAAPGPSWAAALAALLGRRRGRRRG